MSYLGIDTPKGVALLKLAEVVPWTHESVKAMHWMQRVADALQSELLVGRAVAEAAAAKVMFGPGGEA